MIKYLLPTICLMMLGFTVFSADEKTKTKSKKIIRYEPEPEKHYKMLPLGASSSTRSADHKRDDVERRNTHL
jgi:hypothetical protein